MLLGFRDIKSLKLGPRRRTRYGRDRALRAWAKVRATLIPSRVKQLGYRSCHGLATAPDLLVRPRPDEVRSHIGCCRRPNKSWSGPSGPAFNGLSVPSAGAEVPPDANTVDGKTVVVSVLSRLSN